MLNDLRKRLEEGISPLEVTPDEAKILLVEDGFDPQYGARPIRKIIQRLVGKSTFLRK